MRILPTRNTRLYRWFNFNGFSQLCRSDFESHISMYINCVTRPPRRAAPPGGASRDTASSSSQTMCSSLFCFLSFQRLRTKIPRWIAPYTRTSSLQAKPGNNTTNHSPQVKIKHLYNNAIVFKMMRSEHTGLVIIFIFIPSIWLWNGACTGDVNYNDIVRVSKLPVCCARCRAGVESLGQGWQLALALSKQLSDRTSR